MYLFYIFTFLLGAIIGSFINCLVYRLHEEKTLGGRSFCPKCKHQIAWYDNVPVLSFILLKGRCRHCHGRISWQYPAVELIAGLLFLFSYCLNVECRMSNVESFSIAYSLLPTAYLFRDWLVIAVMTVIFLYDLKYYLILDKITLPSIIVFFIINVFLGMNWQNLFISGIIGSSFFLIQFVVSKGRWIGGGDIRLGALMGVILGWPMVMLAIFLAYIIGSVVSVGLVISRQKSWKSQIPLGVFLTTATIIVLFWGQGIWEWYWNSFLIF